MEKTKEILSKSIEFIRNTMIDFNAWIQLQDQYTCFAMGAFFGYLFAKIF
jgi:hypothetical protein